MALFRLSCANTNAGADGLLAAGDSGNRGENVEGDAADTDMAGEADLGLSRVRALVVPTEIDRDGEEERCCPFRRLPILPTAGDAVRLRCQ